MPTLSSIPTAPNALPLLGHLVPVLRNPLEFLASLPAHEDLVDVRLGPAKVIVVCDPELVRQVLRDDRTFDRGGPLFKRAQEVLGSGLATCPHNAHRRPRRLVQPAFNSTRLAGYAQAMTAGIAEATGSWRDGQILDIPAEMLTITFKILTATMFSALFSDQVVGHVIADVPTVVDGWYRRMLMPPPLDRLPTPGNRAYLRARSRLHHSIDGVIAERRASGTDHGDLLSALLATRDPEPGSPGLTDTEISDTIRTFFVAGAEPVAITLSWALHLLAQHPHIQQRLHTEVGTVLAGRPATHADLPKLELTGRIITETLRLRPPAWLLTRTVTTTTRLGRHTLPAAATVACSPYLVHHRSDLYDNPAAFDPDRWDPLHRPQPPRHALIPFGGGARKCVGDTFAMIQATLILATITARWHLQPLPGNNVRPVTSIALRPRKLRMLTTLPTALKLTGETR